MTITEVEMEGSVMCHIFVQRLAPSISAAS